LFLLNLNNRMLNSVKLLSHALKIYTTVQLKRTSTAPGFYENTRSHSVRLISCAQQRERGSKRERGGGD